MASSVASRLLTGTSYSMAPKWDVSTLVSNWTPSALKSLGSPPQNSSGNKAYNWSSYFLKTLMTVWSIVET